MPQNDWYCQKCGSKNENDYCIQCGGPKLLSESAHGILYYIFQFIIFCLVMFDLFFLAFAVPSFKDVFDSFGVKLPWNVMLVEYLGDVLKPFRIVEVIIIVGLAIYIFVNKGIKRKIKISYLIIAFIFLLIISAFIVGSMFMPMFHLGGGFSNNHSIVK